MYAIELMVLSSCCCLALYLLLDVRAILCVRGSKRDPQFSCDFEDDEKRTIRLDTCSRKECSNVELITILASLAPEICFQSALRRFPEFVQFHHVSARSTKSNGRRIGVCFAKRCSCFCRDDSVF